MTNKNAMTEKPIFKIEIECLTCTEKSCKKCRHAIRETNKTYCTKLREYIIRHVINCPEFDEEPIEYKLFKRI